MAKQFPVPPVQAKLSTALAKPQAFKPYGSRIMPPPAALPVQAKLSSELPKQQYLNRATLIKPLIAPRPVGANKATPRTPSRANFSTATIQNKPIHRHVPLAATSLIQRANDPAYSRQVLDNSSDAGARMKALSKVHLNIDTVKRKKMSWFGKGILKALGVEEKPPVGAHCQKCGRSGSPFELDHMTPWRLYVAAMVDEDDLDGNGNIRADVVKALYNDPENLWWICRDCNNPKSDIVPETAAHAAGDFSSGTRGRNRTPSTLLPY